MTIGELTVWVVITQGGTGDWKQRYLVRIPVTGTGRLDPRQLRVAAAVQRKDRWMYVAYHPEHWWNPTPESRSSAPKPPVQEVAAVGRSYSKRCIGCHTTGFRIR